MIVAGLTLQGACIAVALLGIEVLHFWLAMVLLGLGWNFTYTAATTPDDNRLHPGRTQQDPGHDEIRSFIRWWLSGSLSSGAFIHFLGWNWVNIGAMPMLLFTVLVTIWHAAAKSKAADS